MASATAAADPHQGIHKGISLITGFHREIDAILICVRVNGIGDIRISQLFQHVLSASQPTIGLDDNESGRLVGSL